MQIAFRATWKTAHVFATLALSALSATSVLSGYIRSIQIPVPKSHIVPVHIESTSKELTLLLHLWRGCT